MISLMTRLPSGDSWGPVNTTPIESDAPATGLPSMSSPTTLRVLLPDESTTRTLQLLEESHEGV